MAARPNNPNALAGHVQGLREAKAAFQKMPEAFRDRLLDATETTLSEIVRVAKGKVQSSPSIRTRSLYNAIGYSLNRKSGRGRAGVANVTTRVQVRIMAPVVGRSFRTVRIKGIIIPGRGGSALTSEGAKVVRPSRYAHLVEFGARHMAAEPFMIPATEGEQTHFLDRCRKAGQAAEKDIAAIGAGTL